MKVGLGVVDWVAGLVVGRGWAMANAERANIVAKNVAMEFLWIIFAPIGDIRVFRVQLSSIRSLLSPNTKKVTSTFL
jgi:hypothetical protein